MKIWFDAEGDFLEMIFSEKPGFMRATDNDAVGERVDKGVGRTPAERGRGR